MPAASKYVDDLFGHERFIGHLPNRGFNFIIGFGA